jgi:hypothetical protein
MERRIEPENSNSRCHLMHDNQQISPIYIPSCLSWTLGVLFSSVDPFDLFNHFRTSVHLPRQKHVHVCG